MVSQEEKNWRDFTKSLQSTGFSYGGLLTARVVLGVFEAGFGPAIPLYFCEFSSLVLYFRNWLTIFGEYVTAFFYTTSEMGLRMAFWFGFAAVAGAFGGLVAFGVEHAHTAIANWRLLFIVEVRDLDPSTSWLSSIHF